MKKSEICRAAQFYLATSRENSIAELAGHSTGICSALDRASIGLFDALLLDCEEVFLHMGIENGEWLNGAYLLTPLMFDDEFEVKEAYTARVMLLELAAILYEEESGD